VEFALTLPVIILLVVGVLDFARAYKYGLQLNDAAFQGARTASDPAAADTGPPCLVSSLHPCAIRSAVRSDLPSDVVVADSDITISPSGRVTGNTVTVTVSWQYTPLLPFSSVFFPTGVPLVGTGAMVTR